MRFRNIILIASAVSLLGCNNAAPDNGNQAATANGNSANVSNVTAVTNKAPANANTNANKPTDSSPKRIAFSKGANWGATNVTLAAGGAQKFVVTARSGQTMEVESSSSEVSINLVKGKAMTTEDFGFLNAELQANGDFVFEVRNSTKKEVKASVKVTISGGEAKSDPTYEEPIPDDDQEEEASDAPQPTGRPRN